MTLHRLNRTEYDNTIRDLLGDTSGPAAAFPVDPPSYGFDNIAEHLSLAPLLFEKYGAAAETLVERAWEHEYTPAQKTRILGAEASATIGRSFGVSAWNLQSGGEVFADIDFTASATYRISVEAFGQQISLGPARMALLLDGRVLKELEVPAEEASPGIYVVDTPVTAGKHRLAARFMNDYAGPAGDRNLVIDWLQVERPGVTRVPFEQAKLRLCDAEIDGGPSCARRILERFARKAWRRPLGAGEIDPYLMLAMDGMTAGFDQAIKNALQAVLLSPQFLFRVELDPDPASMAPHPLTDHELASRLSYFLWSTMPDDALSAAADGGRLRDRAALEAEVRRMLRDGKARALVDNFAGQWLQTRALAEVQADPQLFPELTEELKAAMGAEAQAFFHAFLHEDRDARGMLDADFTYANEALAAHYRLSPVAGTDLRPVSLAGTERSGLLTLGSILTLTSHPTRTSPVRRGKWVLAQLLCDEPPPPPPNVESLDQKKDPNATLRQQLEQHRANPICASCHAVIDPIGFGLEGFDAIGRFRSLDNGRPVDDSGMLPDGRTFDGARELGAALKGDARFTECMVRQLFIYALGRAPTACDEAHLAHLTQAFIAKGGRLSELMVLVATSTPFTSRRGEREGGP